MFRFSLQDEDPANDVTKRMFSTQWLSSDQTQEFITQIKASLDPQLDNAILTFGKQPELF